MLAGEPVKGVQSAVNHVYCFLNFKKKLRFFCVNDSCLLPSGGRATAIAVDEGCIIASFSSANATEH